MSALRSLTLFAAILSGCGGVDPGSGGYGDDRVAAEAELGRIQAALGEASCGSTAPDAVLDPNTLQTVGSLDGSYDHPTCRNGFVVEVPGATAGRQFTGGTPGMQWPDPFTCLFWWGYLSLWQKQQSGSYVKISESASLGSWFAYPRVGYVCAARGTVQIPADGDYKLVAAGGVLFGAFTVVTVQ